MLLGQPYMIHIHTGVYMLLGQPYMIHTFISRKILYM